MILMTGYELPMRAIREQIASAVDVIVHTARLRDGSRKIVSITEVFGIEEDAILTQEIFTFRQTDFRDGRVIGQLEPTGIRPTFMPLFAAKDIPLPSGEFGIPPEDPSRPVRARKSRWTLGTTAASDGGTAAIVGQGRVTVAGGMVYVSSVGPIDPAMGQVTVSDVTAQTRQCLHNLRARLESVGSSLDEVVWANWALRDAADFDAFSEEWLRWFPGDGPIGQGTLLPLSHRRAGFKVTLGVIAAGSDAHAVHPDADGKSSLAPRVPVPLDRQKRNRRRRRALLAIPVERSGTVAPGSQAPSIGPAAETVETVVGEHALPLGDIDPELYARHFPDAPDRR
jgi:enamine deaminase RidA (YjgF/YER057c/UK114 family)